MCCNNTTPRPTRPEPTQNPGPCQNCDQCPQTFIDKMRACNGGIWDEARAAMGKDPTITVGVPASGMGGHADPSTGEVVIKPNDPCSMAQTLVFELNNLASTPRFQEVVNGGVAGDLSREEYIRGMERIEYDGLRRVLGVYDACKETWCCERSASRYEWIRSSRDFEDYFAHRLSLEHKEHYGKQWDEFRAARLARQA